MFKRHDIGVKPTRVDRILLDQHFLGVEGTEFYVKRDDMCARHLNFGGSAARKVEFVLVDIATSRSKNAILVGRYGSPFMLQLAHHLVCLEVGVHCMFVNDFLPEYTHWLSMLQISGAHTYGKVGFEQVNAIATDLSKDGSVSITLYEGTKSVAFMAGYSIYEELALNMGLSTPLSKATVYVGVDTGSTMAGMVLASKVSTLNDAEKQIDLVGVPLFGDIQQHAESTADNFKAAYVHAATHQVELPPSEESVACSFSAFKDREDHLPGSKNLNDFISRFFLATGILLDSTYGAPTALTMISDVQNGKVEGPVIFVNPSLPIIPYFNYTPQAIE